MSRRETVGEAIGMVIAIVFLFVLLASLIVGTTMLVHWAWNHA